MKVGENGHSKSDPAEGTDDVERRRTEAALRESEEKYKALIETTGVGYAILSPDGGVLDANEEYVRLTGHRKLAEITGHSVIEWTAPYDRERNAAEIRKCLQQGLTKDLEIDYVKGEGRITPVAINATVVTNSRGIQILALFRDITHELDLESQYHQTQKIDGIGRLAGGVAHDFNNILTTILGNAELALTQLPADAPLRSNIESIQESAARAANLTRQLLAFARRQVIEPRLVNPNELIANLSQTLRRLLGKDIELVMQPSPDLGQIKADPGQIEQVLLNLVVNARDAMPRGGILTFCTDNATLDKQYATRHLVTPGEYVRISVSDTGVGMTNEVKRHIFEPFFTTKEQGKGTGLGLATCFGIIQQSNGHIHSDSQLGKGTRFEIYLPRVCGTQDAAASREAPIPLPQGSETILLAEDEPSLRLLITRVLRTQGYTVLEAADGNEALALAQANGSKIQLLLTDVIMPGLSGKMLAEWLTQVNPGIKVLFISGYINNAAVRGAMSKPGMFFLQKPFNPLTLAKKVRAALEAPNF
jgi:PAS domain S-box-containing protein